MQVGAWRKAVLARVTLPLLVVKNGIRIVTLSTLSVYVDSSFLTGSLHERGGSGTCPLVAAELGDAREGSQISD